MSTKKLLVVYKSLEQECRIHDGRHRICVCVDKLFSIVYDEIRLFHVVVVIVDYGGKVGFMAADEMRFIV